MGQFVYFYGRILIVITTLFCLQSLGFLEEFLNQYPSARLDSFSDFFSTLAIFLIAIMAFERPVAVIWNAVTPVKKPTYTENQLIFGLALSFGTMLLGIMANWFDFTNNVPGSYSLFWILPVTFLISIPSMLFGWVVLRRLCESTTGTLSDSYTIKTNDDVPIASGYLRKSLSYILAALVFTFIVMASIVAIVAFHGSRIGPEALKSLIHCSAFTAFFLIFFGNIIVRFGRGILKRMRLYYYFSGRWLLAASYFSGYMAVLTMACLLPVSIGKIQIENLWSYVAAYGLIGVSALIAGYIFSIVYEPRHS